MGLPGAFPLERDTVGDFELVAKLATGGMAEIFLARRASRADARSSDDGEFFVIKRILAHLAEDEHFVQMFRDEAALASQIVHPNVGRVYGMDCDRGMWFMVMEHLHGVPLSRIMALQAHRRQPFTPAQLCALIDGVCAGLGYAHDLAGGDGQALGLVHRDISPPNVYVTAHGQVKVLDFGIAKTKSSSAHTRTGTIKGKNAYMSPEQILGQPLDRRSDVFALGAVLWELLALARLFQRDNEFATFKAITEQPVPDVRAHNPYVSDALAAVVAKALARRPDDRFATCTELAHAVAGALSQVPDPAHLAAFMATSFCDELATKDPAHLLREGLVRVPRASAPPMGALAPVEAAFTPTTMAHLDVRAISRRRARMGVGLVLGGVVLAAVLGAWVAHRAPQRAEAAAEVAGEAVRAVDDSSAPAQSSAPAPSPTRALAEREEIVALSKFGFWSFSAPSDVVVYIDGKRVGAAPFERYALSPGFHDIRLTGPKGKAAAFRIAIYGGQETTTPPWKW